MGTINWNHISRRQLLKAGALGVGALTVGVGGSRLTTLAQSTPAAATPLPSVFDPAVCYAPMSGSKPVQYKAVGSGPFKIALSNSYIGNVWRTQMMQMAQAFVKHDDIASRIASFEMNSAGTDDSAQIAAIEDMISKGAQAIVIDANTPGGQVNVLQQARADGIVIVAFDNTVDSDQIVQVNQDQTKMGQLWAQFLVDQLDGKGKILMVNGVPGTTVDTDRRNGAYEVFKAHSDIKYIEVDGEWDPGKAQSATATALASNSDIAGVWCQGGTNGAFQAFLDAGAPLVPFAGEAENGFRKQMLKYKDKINCLSIGQTPAMVCVAIRMALDLLDGKEMPSFVSMPLPMATTDQLVPGENVFPDAPDSFFTPIQVPGCGVDLTIDEIQAQKV